MSESAKDPGISIEGAARRGEPVGFEKLQSLPGQVDDVAAIVAGRTGAAVRLASVLETSGIPADATHLTVESDDGTFAASVPLEAVRDAVIVYSLGGEPLPREKGGPFRLLIPDAARCGSAEVDKCANVKNVGVLRLDVGHGHDTRPQTKTEHIEMHRKPAHRHSH
jgi:hypothetical protein